MIRTGGGRYTQDIDQAREEPFHDSQTVQTPEGFQSRTAQSDLVDANSTV